MKFIIATALIAGGSFQILHDLITGDTVNIIRAIAIYTIAVIVILLFMFVALKSDESS